MPEGAEFAADLRAGRRRAYREAVARYAAEQIYAFARSAGFEPDEAVTMTAIALAESNGRSSAHNTQGENSRGLWQINALAHPDLAAELDLFDPSDNARAAFLVSGGGRDISPWTTTHGGSRAAYLRYRTEAQAAAVAHGDAAGLGMWSGTAGYGDHRAAGTHHHGYEDAGSSVSETPHERAGLELDVEPGRSPHLSSDAAANSDARPGLQLDVGSTPEEAPSSHPSAGQAQVEQFVETALAQRGDQYVFGAHAALNDPNPRAFDCSELVKWAAHQSGMEVPDGAGAQYVALRDKGLVIPVEQARHTRGALLFSFSSEPTRGGGEPAHAHVAISLGDGHTIEARGRAYGVNVFDATPRRFQYAALMPQAGAQPGSSVVEGQSEAASVSGEPSQSHTGGLLLDTDGEGLGDRLARRLESDPFSQDVVADRLHDTHALLFGGEDPMAGDDSAAWSPQADSTLLAASQQADGSAFATESAHVAPFDHSSLASDPADDPFPPGDDTVHYSSDDHYDPWSLDAPGDDHHV